MPMAEYAETLNDIPEPAGSGSRDRLRKVPTGIHGLDEITHGGLPRGRPTLICGGAGCGKTIFGLSFLVNGIRDLGEPGVFIAFEETPEDLAMNVSSLGFDLRDLEAQGRLAVDYVHVDKSQIAVAGAYDLEGLFIRLQAAVETVGAKRVVVDTLETLFGGFDNPALLREELKRLFRWFKDRGLTVVITAERGDGALTRQGLEEYVSDCVILLDHRVADQISTRRLRVVKYRGSLHGTNEYPFLIDRDGISVLPLSSLGLAHEASEERVSSGVPQLDAMLEGEGYYRGSSVMVTGTAGSGKTSLALHLADSACRRGERVAYFAFEESPSQIIRNMRSIGLDLARWVDAGLLRFHASRPSVHGLEMHLVQIMRHVREFAPGVVVVDPVSNLTAMGTAGDINALLVRLIDFLKEQGITAFLTSLTSGTAVSDEATEVGISSLIDTWILVRDIETSGERNRGLFILKSRGMAHSNQIREFRLTRDGIRLLDVRQTDDGVLTGSQRAVHEARERAAALALEQEIQSRQAEIERKRKAVEAKMAALEAEMRAEEEALRRDILLKRSRQEIVRKEWSDLDSHRQGAAEPGMDRFAREGAAHA